MKRWAIALLILLFSPVLCLADGVVLNSSETVVSSVNADNIVEWHISYLSQSEKKCVVRFKWASGSTVVSRDGEEWDTFGCKNYKKDDGTQIEDSECTAAGTPYTCCTANNEGVCKCFSDVFAYTLQAGDAGTAIGIKQRNLLWQQAKKKLLSPGNDGTF